VVTFQNFLIDTQAEAAETNQLISTHRIPLYRLSSLTLHTTLRRPHATTNA